MGTGQHRPGVTPLRSGRNLAGVPDALVDRLNHGFDFSTPYDLEVHCETSIEGSMPFCNSGTAPELGMDPLCPRAEGKTHNEVSGFAEMARA